MNLYIYTNLFMHTSAFGRLYPPVCYHFSLFLDIYVYFVSAYECQPFLNANSIFITVVLVVRRHIQSKISIKRKQRKKKRDREDIEKRPQ